MKIIVKSKEELDALILDQIKSTVEEKPNAVFGLDPSADLISVYEKLRDDIKNGSVSFTTGKSKTEDCR